MSIVTVQKPDSLSMSGNMKDLILQSADPVLVKLSVGGQTILEEAYYPGNGNLIHVDFREVAESYLSFTLPSSDVFIQPRLAAEFSVTYDSETYTFSCIKSGKLNLNESASQFLAGNFLTWQPTQKAVTYYSPEWLTYYATDDCSVRLRAYWEDGTNTSITLSTQSRGTCVTYNLQYAVIYGKFTPKRPMYYDVWVENASGARLSYVQRYLASEKQGEDENWYLFENSLGGIDSLRAYGALKDDPEYTHNLASFGDESEEYRIDSNRLLTRNTGMLTPEEARWLQDMFVARRKYVYTLSGLYRIVFTSSDAKTDSANPPTSYSFTYRLADNRPYLDIQRRTDLPENLVIPVPTGETFFLPPRLAEFPKPSLSPDLLIPVQEPHTEVWGTTTTGQIHDSVLNDLIRALDGLDLNPIQSGGGGGLNVDIIKLNDLTIPSDSNVFSSLRTLKEIDDAIDGLIVDIDGMYLRKDIDDIAHGNIFFEKEIGSSIFTEGWNGKGWKIQASGSAVLNDLRVKSDLLVGNVSGSPTFASGFTGWGWQIDTPTATGEMDNLFIRKTFTAYEIVYSQIYGLGGSQIVSDINKIARVENLGDRYRCYMDDMDGLMLMNLRKGDGVRIQTRIGTTSIKYLFGRCIGVDNDYFDISIPLLEGGGEPQAGDFALRWGNNDNTDRQGLIYLTTADSGAPFIDVYDGITDSSTEGKLKARLGHLTGIRTQRGDQLYGYGAYLNGIYIENSTYIMQDGNSIEQTFIAMNGKFESIIESIRNDISSESGNILVNSSFSRNTNYWTAANNVHFININGEYLWVDGNFYVEKGRVADIYNDNGKNVLRIINTYILQQNAVMNVPEHEVVNGVREKKVYSFSLFYKVLRSGQCSFGVPGTDLYYEASLTESDSYQSYKQVGKWDGTGNFELRFTGEILIYGVGLFADTMADAIIKLQTQILQTEEYIKLLATKEYVNEETGKVYLKYDGALEVTAEQISAVNTRVDNINNRINTAGWITSADSVNIFAQELNKTGIKTSIANLEVKYNEISSAVSDNEQGITNVRNLANSAASEAAKALLSGVYGQEQYSQTGNPWQSWPSGQEYKHVGALWYNPSTGVTKRYTGTDGSNKWEDVSNSSITAASYVLQNKDKWSLVVANFDSQGNPTEASGIITQAYGNTLWAKKNGIISAINQTPETISIDASKINLNGAVTANNYFKILTDGSMQATSGKIASFNIGEDAITISRNGIYSGFGVNTAPATLGLNVPLWIRNTSNEDTCYAAYFEATGGLEHNYALSLKGCLQMRGGFSNLERTKYLKFSEGAGSDSIQIWFKDYDTFIINNNSGKYMSVYLPRYDGDITGDYKKTSFILDILVMTGSDTINLSVLGSQTYIRDHNGNIINSANGNANGNLDMAKGDSIRLLYFGQVYHVLNRNY